MSEFLKRNHQLMFIADSIPTHLNYLDNEERFVFVNKAAADYWQLSPKAMVGKTIKELMGEEAYKQIKETLIQVLGGETITHEFPFQAPDGSVGYFLNSYVPDKDNFGKVIGFVATGTDITERRKALECAEKLAKDFKTLANSMPQIVWTANPDGLVDYYNERFYAYTGLSTGCLDESMWLKIVHPEDIDLLQTTWQKALFEGKPYEMEFRIRHVNTEEYRWHLTRAIPIRNQKGEVIKWYGSNTDIHDSKLDLQNLEIEKNIRDQIVSTLSHDLRTPLTTVKMSSQLILKMNLDDSIKKLAQRIKVNIDRADKMIQNLLDVSKLKAGHSIPINTSTCDLVLIAREVIEEFAFNHGERFLLQSPASLLGVWDCDGLRRILENLLSNAVKYGAFESQIHINLGQSNSVASLEIVNFGNPISSHELSLLFAPYARTKTTHNIQGWGLGLSLVKGLTEAHGGEVKVSSTLEDGTRFKVLLPLA